VSVEQSVRGVQGLLEVGLDRTWAIVVVIKAKVVWLLAEHVSSASTAVVDQIVLLGRVPPLDSLSQIVVGIIVVSEVSIVRVGGRQRLLRSDVDEVAELRVHASFFFVELREFVHVDVVARRMLVEVVALAQSVLVVPQVKVVVLAEVVNFVRPLEFSVVDLVLRRQQNILQGLFAHGLLLARLRNVYRSHDQWLLSLLLLLLFLSLFVSFFKHDAHHVNGLIALVRFALLILGQH